MPFIWEDRFSVGVKLIDDQHKELFKRMNTLLNAVSKGEQDAETIRIMFFLRDYVITHFRDEENLMETYGYPETHLHKAEHQNLMKDLKLIIDEYKSVRDNRQIYEQLKERLADWVIHHTTGIDQDLGVFLKSLNRES